MHVQSMLSTHPAVRGTPDAAVVRCIEQCLDCGQTCILCADACLAEEMVRELRRCISLNHDCADICGATARILGRRVDPDARVQHLALQACAEICRTCAEECDRHAGMHEHCRICAEACRDCQRACEAVMNTLPSVQ